MTVRKEPGYLLIEGVGSIATLDDQKNWSDACYREIVDNNARRVLIDDRLLQFKVSLFDQYDVVMHYRDEYENEIMEVRVAIVVNNDNEELHDFWELYANNRGFPWKVFREMDPAIAYLTED